MNNNRSYAAPKRFKDTAPDPHEITLKAYFGSNGALFAFINHNREIGTLKQGRYSKRADGSVEQTITLTLYELAKSYQTRPEKPYVDKSGDLYVFQSEREPDKIKVGISIHVPVRVQQVSRKFEEPFRRIHSVHCDNAKARETWVHNQLREMGAVDLGYERFRVKDRHLEWLYSLPNE